jgi:hypothetical protein
LAILKSVRHCSRTTSSPMQTFLPFACVDRSLRRLDHKRLHKQLTEAIQILRILQALKRGETPGYHSHPAILMWRGHEEFLRFYACRCSVVIKETTRRVSDGQPYDTVKRDLALREELGGWVDHAPPVGAPVWLGNDDFHGPHRASLYRKNPEFYAEFKADAERWEDYYWPVRSQVAVRKRPVSNKVAVHSKKQRPLPVCTA